MVARSGQSSHTCHSVLAAIRGLLGPGTCNIGSALELTGLQLLKFDYGRPAWALPTSLALHSPYNAKFYKADCGGDLEPRLLEGSLEVEARLRPP